MNKEHSIEDIKISLIQADIIYKALHYVARHEDIPMEEELNDVFQVLAEDNPYQTESVDVLHVMEYLRNNFITNEPYQEYYLERKELNEDE